MQEFFTTLLETTIGTSSKSKRGIFTYPGHHHLTSAQRWPVRPPCLSGPPQLCLCLTWFKYSRNWWQRELEKEANERRASAVSQNKGLQKEGFNRTVFQRFVPTPWISFHKHRHHRHTAPDSAKYKVST